MKRIIQKIFLVILAIIVAAVGVSIYQYFTGPVTEPAKPTLTDAQGSTYLAVVGDDGTTYAVVTDESGNRYAAEYNGSDVGNTVGQINDHVAQSDLPTNYTGPTLEATADASAYKGDVQTTNSATSQVAQTTVASTTQATTVKPEDTTAQTQQTTVQGQQTTQGGQTTSQVQQTTTQAQNGAETGLTAYRIQKYLDVFSNGTYLMEVSTADIEEPFTIAMKNGNVYLETKMEIDETQPPYNCRILILNNGETMYLIIDDVKKYFKVPADLLGEDMDMASMMADFADVELGEITVSEVEINGQKLILESYISPTDGSTINYYFDGDVLVRKDNVDKNGKVDSTYFSRVTSDVPDSTFDLPAGYGYFNMSLLGAFL